MLVASAVLPIDGRPARITRSEGCSPPSFLSRSASPVVTPVIWPSRLNAASAIMIALVDGVGERLQPAFGLPGLGEIEELLLGRLDLLGRRDLEIVA